MLEGAVNQESRPQLNARMLASIINSPLCEITLGKPYAFSVHHFFHRGRHDDIPHLHMISPRLGAYLLHALGHRKIPPTVSTWVPISDVSYGFVGYLFSISIYFAIIRLCSGNFSMHHGEASLWVILHW